MSQTSQRVTKLTKAVAYGTAACLVALAAGCGDDSGSSGIFAGDTGQPDDASRATQPRIPDTPDEVALAAAEDVEEFWEDAYPEIYGGSLRPLRGDWNAYSSTTPPPSCGPYSMTYEEARSNAFYCPADDFIAYDEEELLPWVWDSFGGFTIAVVMAHEFGHAVQERQFELDDHDSVRVEMQADCFAGAWVGWVDDGNSDSFAININQLDSVVGGMIAIRDLPGMDPDSPFAHGSGFDRVSSFKDGFDNGPEACAEYTDRQRRGDLAVTQIPFHHEDEQGGNLPLEDDAGGIGLYTLSEEFLEIFYQRLFAEQLEATWEPVDELVVVDPERDEVTCGGDTLRGPDQLEWFSAYCADENIVVIDGATMAPQLFDRIGDFAVAAEIARLWAFAAQEQLGIDEQSQGTNLQADCLTGYWAGALFPDNQDRTALGPHPDDPDLYPRLSAGDLDEALISIVAYGGARRADTGTVFERSSAMRAGVLDGIAGSEGVETCSRYHPFES